MANHHSFMRRVVQWLSTAVPNTIALFSCALLLFAAPSTASTAPVTIPTNFQGLWWNANESGWGMSVTQQGSTIFAAAYTYDQTGQPTWYVMSSCPLSGNSCTGTLYKVIGGTSPALPWNGAGKVVSSAGTGTLTFSDNSTGSFSYSLNGISGSKSITRQSFASGTLPPEFDYSDLWWNANESGWGVAITQEYGTIFAAWYTYDATGKAVWYVASNCPISGNGCTGDLYKVTGGSPLTSTWNGSGKAVTKVGTLSFVFADANNGSMNYSINGAAGSRSITRQQYGAGGILSGNSADQTKFINARGYPDIFTLGFVTQGLDSAGQVVALAIPRRIETWAYNGAQFTSALFDNGFFVSQQTWGSGTTLQPTILRPDQFKLGMTEAQVITLMGQPSCVETLRIAGSSIRYLRYNPSSQSPVATVTMENGSLGGVTAGYATVEASQTGTNICTNGSRDLGSIP